MTTNGMCFFLFLISFISTISCKAIDEEPVCTSRYDFESRLLRGMLKIEFEMNLLKDNTNRALTEFDEKLTSALSKLDTFSIKLNVEHESKLQEMTELGTDIQASRANLANDFAVMYKDFEGKTDSKWQAIEAQASKPPVAFLAHTVSTTSPGQNKKLRFTTIVSNTGDAYDTSTGFFTAPVSGTYWFSVQMCPQYQLYVHVHIYAEKTLIGNSIMYGSTSKPCSTTSAVAVLNVGNKVHVKAGDYTSHIQQDSYRWAVFSGALVH